MKDRVCVKMFETKESIPEKRKKRFYNILMGYWIVVPVFYFLMFFLLNAGADQSFQEILSENLTATINILVLSMNLIGAYILYATEFSERKKGGISDIVLKFSIAQQLILGNFVGAIFSFLAFNELVENPLLTEKEQLTEKPLKAKNKKGIIILQIALIVLSLGIAIVNWRISNAS